MNCVNCGAPLKDLSVSGKYVKCEYCNTENAIFTVSTISLDKTHNISLQGLNEKSYIFLSLAEVDMKNNNFTDALKYYENIIVEDPGFWQAYLKKAICIFLLNKKDIDQLHNVVILLGKAEILSNGAHLVIESKKEIAFNLVSYALNRDNSEEKILWCFTAIRISVQLVQNYEERDNLIQSFISKETDKITARLLRQVDLSAVDINLPLAGIQILESLIELDKINYIQLYQSYIAFSIYREKIKGMKQLNSIKNEFLLKAIEKYRSISNNTVLPSLKIPFLGSSYIKT